MWRVLRQCECSELRFANILHVSCVAMMCRHVKFVVLLVCKPELDLAATDSTSYPLIIVLQEVFSVIFSARQPCPANRALLLLVCVVLLCVWTQWTLNTALPMLFHHSIKE